MTASNDPAPQAETDPHTPPHVDDFSVEVAQSDGEWTVTTVADGVRRLIGTYSDEADARREADSLEAAAVRYDGAPRQEAVPETYPGKGVDETQAG